MLDHKIKILEIMPATNWWAEFQEKDGIIHYEPVAFFVLREIEELDHATYGTNPYQDCVPVLMDSIGNNDMYNTDIIAGLNRYFYSIDDPREQEYTIGMIGHHCL